METSDDLQGAWSSLRREEWTQPGVYERRLSASTVHSVYAVLMRPSGQVGIALDLPPAIGAGVPEDAARGFVLRKEWKRETDTIRLVLLLSDDRFADVFGVLASDVFEHIRQARTLEAGADALRARLEHWKKFLKAAGDEGLSTEAQIGLYGELFVMRRWLGDGKYGAAVVLASWQGPARANQDFQRADLAVEVKTTTSNDIQSVRITNERQLDETGLRELFLCHLAFDRRENSGQTLPELVAEVAGLLGAERESGFSDLLASVGYHRVHEGRYAVFGYSPRFAHIYHVTGGFPRIRQSELRSGVSEVSYAVNVSNLERDVPDVARLGEMLFKGEN